jgi:hypothetical protein
VDVVPKSTEKKFNKQKTEHEDIDKKSAQENQGAPARLYTSDTKRFFLIKKKILFKI